LQHSVAMADTTTPPIDSTDAASPHDALAPLHQPIARSREGRLIAGVADGLAQAWGRRTWLVRFGFLLATALAGLGFVLYAAGWLLIPEEGRPESIAQRIVRRMSIQRTWVGFLLLLAGGLIVGGVANIDGGVLMAGALLVTGYALYTGAFTVAPLSEADDGDRMGPGPEYERAPRPARPSRPKSYLGRLTVGAMMVALGMMGVFDAMGAIRPTSRHYAAIAVLVIGFGLMFGTIYGRSRGLIVLGVLLLPVLALGAIADYRFGSTWEYLNVTPASVGELQPSYRIASGNISIDLSEVEFRGETASLDVDTGVGNIYVYVPPGVAVDASANAILGEVGVGGSRSSGLGAEVVHTVDGDAGRLVIDADVRIGSVEVYYRDVGAIGPSDEPAESGGVAIATTPAGSFVQVVEGVGFEEPRGVSEIARTYEILDGRLVLDLTEVLEPDAAVRISFVGYGEAVVIVPPDARIFASGDIPNADFSGIPDDGVPVWERPGDGITLVINSSGPSVWIEEGL